MDSGNWFVDPPPPSNSLPYLKVIRVPKGGKIQVVILSSDVVGCRVHRVENKPFLCPGEGCPILGCPDSGRWQGYIEVVAPPEPKRLMLELTLETYHRIRCISVENSLQMRGLHLLLERTGPQRNASIIVTQMDTMKFANGASLARDLRPFVLRLYKKR